jgi:hypothetical protein
MGSRLQNILISSAIISVLSTLHDDRLRALVLANTPERLGEWRRGLQDCLGILVVILALIAVWYCLNHLKLWHRKLIDSLKQIRCR